MRGRRIPETKRILALELRRKGLSVREIAAAVGLSRSSAARICGEGGDGPAVRTEPFGRCPRCGALVRLPCLACAIRAADARRREAWRREFAMLEETMDLVKEIQELKKAVEDALEDRRITLLELIKIAKEAADVLRILGPVILGSIDARAAQEEKEAEA